MAVIGEVQAEWMEALLGGATGARREALGAVLGATRELEKAEEIAPLMAAAAVAPMGDKGLERWLKILGRAESQDAMLAVWDEPLGRRAGLALALRWGATFTGDVSDFLFAELDALDPDDPEQMAHLSAALEAVAAAAPGEVFDLVGLCAPGALRWLSGLEAARADKLLGRYGELLGDELAGGALPAPADAQALWVLELLDSPLGDKVLSAAAARARLSVGAASARIARLCVGVGLSSREGGEGGLEARPGAEGVDADTIRGLLDAMQIPCDDLSSDSWALRLAYKDAFGQRARAKVILSLTGRRVRLAATLERTTRSVEELLRQSRYAGAASYTLDSAGAVVVRAEIVREGFAQEVLSQVLEDVALALEWAVG